MVIITVPHLEYSSEVTDPFYLRCQVDLYCREQDVLENLSQAIGGYIELPYIPHLGRILTQEECWLAHMWFSLTSSLVRGWWSLVFSHRGL
jgi:hypothetical protein